MKFKLKQPTKYMHQTLEKEDSDFSQDLSHSQDNKISQQKDNEPNPMKGYRKKKTIKKKNEPSAARLSKINQTFENIYHNSAKLFSDLKIDQQKLNNLSELKIKNKCLCNKNVKFYCLKCMKKVCQQPFPFLQLPFQISIIHHESQKINKSSALPLSFLTNQTKIHIFSSVSEQKNDKLWQQLPKPDKGVYILFPHKKSKLIEQILSKPEKVDQQKKITHLIILDCTWFQTDQILQILQSKGYKQFVRIQGYKSLYWRYNHHNDEALSSVQAIAFFMRQYQKAYFKSDILQEKNPQNTIEINNHSQNVIKKYDNLLFLYCLNLKMILKDQQSRIKVLPEDKSKKQQIKS